MRRSPQRNALRIIVLLAAPFLIRVACFLELRRSIFFRLLVVDARTNHDAAVQMANGTFSMTGPFWQPPFYPFLLSLVYRVTGPHPDAMRVLQALLGAVSCLLLFRIGERLFGRRAAWIAWGCAALCGPLIFFDLQLLNAAVAAALLLFAIDRMVRWWDGAGDSSLYVAALALGVACITVATALVAVPVFAGWAWWRKHRAHEGSGALFYLVAIAALPVLLVTAINLGATGQPVLISYNGGINFWIGNNPDFEHTVGIRPGRAWQALTAEPLRAGVRSESATSAWFFRHSCAWIGAHPGAWIALLVRKAGLFLRGDEIARNQEIYPFRADSLLLRSLLWTHGLGFPSGLLIPLAGAGLAGVFWRRKGKVASDLTKNPDDGPAFGAGLLAVFALAYSGAVILFFPASRFRLPVLPALILFGAAGLSLAIDAVRAHRWDRLAAPSIVFCALGVISNVAVPPMPEHFHSDTYSDLGTTYIDAGQYDEALRWYEEALKLDPGNAEAAHNAGVAYLKLNRPDDAEPCFRRVLAEYPDDAKALINLGNVYLMRGQPYRAGRYFWQVYRSDPQNSDARADLEQTKLIAAKLEQDRLAHDPWVFLDELEKELRAEPGNDFLRERLRVLLLGAGQTERAKRVAELKP